MPKTTRYTVANANGPLRAGCPAGGKTPNAYRARSAPSVSATVITIPAITAPMLRPRLLDEFIVLHGSNPHPACHNSHNPSVIPEEPSLRQAQKLSKLRKT